MGYSPIDSLLCNSKSELGGIACKAASRCSQGAPRPRRAASAAVKAALAAKKGLGFRVQGLGLRA